MSNSNSITFTVLNRLENLPVIYRNTSCELLLTLKNETGSRIMMQRGKSSLQFSIPDITAEEIKNIQLVAEGWTTAVNGKTMKLTYAGAEEAAWESDTELIFILSQLVTNVQPVTGNVQVVPVNFVPRLPLQLFAPIVISNPPQKGNANLKDVLQLSLDSGGVVYVSPFLSKNSSLDILENELSLNLKNIGEKPLYTGTKKIAPHIEATFVYGNTTGCITPSDEGSSEAYAWKIKASISNHPSGYSWKAKQPSISSDPCPKWVLEPEPANTGLMGIHSEANLTFSFSKIVAVTPPGHTQILLHFSGFMKDDTTAYNDALFVLDIEKQEPPKERGIIQFYSKTPCITVDKPEEKVKLALKWSAYHVDRVDVLIHSPIVRHWSVYYSDYHSPLLKDCMEIELNGVLQDTVYLITIQAYGKNGIFLNSRQFSVIMKADFFTDPRDAKTYPLITVDNKTWMAEDLKYAASRGSTPVEGRESYRVYDWEAAQSPDRIDGWRLPTRDDWESLIKSYEKDPYKHLIKGGSSGFGALLNGMYAGGKLQNLDSNAYYWAADEEETQAGYILFSSTSKTVLVQKKLSFPKNYRLAVRYVKDLEDKKIV